MTCRRAYTCDFCKSSIADPSLGIGVEWTTDNALKSVYLPDAETHLCNDCCRALPKLFVELDLLQKLHDKRDKSP